MWNKAFFEKLKNLGVPDHMLSRAHIGLDERGNEILQLFTQRQIPEKGWDDKQITLFLEFLNSLDSDKDPAAIRIGEREARISTPKLYEQCGGFCHGIGRSGNLTAPQPKAAGASLMQNITNNIVYSLVRKLGLTNIKGALTLPFGTGMALGATLRGLINTNKIDFRKTDKILYLQADHKSPKKGMEYINAEVVTIPGHFGKNHFAPSGVYIDIEDMKEKYEQNSSEIFAIVSTTSFFAPRVPDNIKEVAKFAKLHNLIHVINNAYGLQSPTLIKLIRSAIDAGRVDAIIQSTDKNFLTPVGGSIVISPEKKILESISSVYAGRASAAPVLQLLTSLLSMGHEGYTQLMLEQQESILLLQSLLLQLAEELGEELIECNNEVSCAMSLRTLSPEKIEKLGGFLYNLRVTGPRVLNLQKTHFGTCTTEMPYSYLVMNAAIGVKKEHIYSSVQRLRQALSEI